MSFSRGTPLRTVTLPSRTASRAPLGVFCGESRIGKVPVLIPENVDFKLTGQHLSVKGPLGELEHEFPPEVELVQSDGVIVVNRILDNKKAKAMHGLSRALCSNMFVGVSRGFEKVLILNGVGYKAAVEGERLNLTIGFCHPVYMDIPKGVKVKVEEITRVVISGFDKALVGNFAAMIRSKRPPEPYKGKGIRYYDEVIKLKDAKRGK